MKQFEPSCRTPLGMPAHVADAGRIVLGAGVRLPALKGSATSAGAVIRTPDPSRTAGQKNA